MASEAETKTGGKADATLDLQPGQVNVDAEQLPGDAANALKLLLRKILLYTAEVGLDQNNADRTLSEALNLTLPVDGRIPQFSGLQYAVLALRLRLKPIVDVLERWEEKEALKVIAALDTRWDEMVAAERFNLDLGDVPNWLREHELDSDRGDAVSACIGLDAPGEVRIERRLAQAGAQKRVFAANWTVADDPTEIVIKDFLGEAEQILIRERRPHPLSMTHPNIIETFMLDNQASPPKTFLVERRLEVLNDNKKLSGWSETARLLVDIARALAFLRDQGLVHGDVKPDNIGFQNGVFVLLDFGICRPEAEFVGTSQTGSLRTRAPEVLLGGDHTSKSDVWALGATIFNALFGRFPLFLHGSEKPPNAEKRKRKRRKFERALRRRIEQDWDLHLAPIGTLQHRGLRDLLGQMLDIHPKTRPEAADILRQALRTLPALVGAQEGPRFDPQRELEALRRHLAHDPEQVALLPDRRAKDLESRLMILGRAVRAQRHYQQAADQVAAASHVALQDPLRQLDPVERRHLEELAERAATYRTPSDEAAVELLESVREQLGLRKQPEHTRSQGLIDVLGAAIADARKSGTESNALIRAGVELERLLPPS